jgi:hypothetical protein
MLLPGCHVQLSAHVLAAEFHNAMFTLAHPRALAFASAVHCVACGCNAIMPCLPDAVWVAQQMHWCFRSTSTACLCAISTDW